jgi:hypothetical protein
VLLGGDDQAADEDVEEVPDFFRHGGSLPETDVFLRPSILFRPRVIRNGKLSPANPTRPGQI